MTDTILPLAPRMQAVYDRLDSTFSALPTPIPVGRSQAPRDANQKTHEPPYLFISLLPGGILEGSLSDPQELAEINFQITAVAADETSCLHILDLCRSSFKATPFTVSGQHTMSLRLQLAAAGANLDDTESDPAFMALDRWTLRTSPN